VPGGLPSLALPDVTWDEALAALPVAVSCFIVIIAQSAATARVFAARHGDRVDEDADLLGLSAANAAAAISGTFVVNGSLTQTEMADRAGAGSQLAQLAAAGAVVLVLLFLTGPLQHLPRAVLGGIVFTIAVGLADVRKLFAFRRESPGEFQLAVTTMAVVALVGVEQGILLAMALSLLRHVRHSYRPHTMVIAHGPDGSLLPVPADAGVQTEPGLVIYRFGADLFYANEARFADEVRALVAHAPEPVRWLIVDAAAITDIDYSAARMLRDLRVELHRKGIDVAFARVVEPLRADMDRHGITAAVGQQPVDDAVWVSHLAVGPRVTSPWFAAETMVGRFFAHALAGMARTSGPVSQTAGEFVVGGGIDLLLLRIQGDYVRSNLTGVKRGNGRFFVGGVIPFCLRGCTEADGFNVSGRPATR